MVGVQSTKSFVDLRVQFANPKAEISYAMRIPTDLVAYHNYRPSAVLKFSGEDAFPFLQGQFTQDLRPGKETRTSSYGLWLNQKGKVLADSFVLSDGAHWLVVSLFSSAETICKRLEVYVIADDVTIEDVTTQWAGVSVLGEGAMDVSFAVKGGFAFLGRRTREPNWEWLYPICADAPAAHLRERGFAELDAVAMERLRIEAGIPTVPRDIGPEDLPNEGGLDRDAISYTKGCYLGQEVMARLKTLGQVRRRLMRIEGPVALPTVLPAPLFSDGKKIGDLRSAARTDAGFVGLAMISLLGLAGRQLSSFAPDIPADLVLSALP
jgi:tRNA-modifying protein YgfZ